MLERQKKFFLVTLWNPNDDVLRLLNSATMFFIQQVEMLHFLQTENEKGERADKTLRPDKDL